MASSTATLAVSAGVACGIYWCGKNSRYRRPAAKLLNMQKPNYQFEKRRKEMNKKAKKEEKRRLKLADSQSGAASNATSSVPIEPI
jgi:hypothetical protein